MLENGTISTEEALTLLENLGNEPVADQLETKKDLTQPAFEDQPTGHKETDSQTGKESQESKDSEPSMDEFLDDLRKDFTHVGDRFMQFMQTAVQKVKEFDFDSPFGHSFEFDHTMTKSLAGIDEIVIDVDNGKVTVHATDGDEARAEFTVKSYNSESEATAKEAFLSKVIFVTDDNKLRVCSEMKMTKVNIDLYIPRKNYKKLSARLMNGSFDMKDTKFDKIRVKTSNGKVDASSLSFKDAEFEAANGSINLQKLVGEKLSAETLNGRVYVDGELIEVEAQSLSGHVVVTTTNPNAQKIEAKTMSGSVEIYIPADIALSGEITSNIGRLNLQLNDVDRTAETEQLLQKTIRFKKNLESDTPLYLFGEAKTGSVLVCYNATKK